MRGTTRLAAALLAGAAISSALPPGGWWPLAIVGVALWGWALQNLSWAGRLGVGALIGGTYFAIALAWVPEFTLPGYFLLAALQTAFWGLASVMALGRWAPVGLAGALVLAEAARSNFPFEGLPLAGVDLGQAGGPLLWVARLGGGYAVTLAAGLLGGAVALAASRRWSAVIPAGVACLLALGGWLSPAGHNVGDPLRVAVVQGGGPRGFRGVDTDFSEVLDRHLEATESIEGDVDLVLWPENSITLGRDPGPQPPPDVHKGPLPEPRPEMQLVHRAVERVDALVVAGVVEPSGPDAFINAAVAFVPGGTQHSVMKAIRVPFGEYIPFRSFVDRFADLSAIPSEALPSDDKGLLETTTGKFAVAISYEVFFTQKTRDAVNLGGSIVLVPTNAASFRTSQVPGQELAAARLRAVETGRWLLQAAPTGYSAIVTPRGQVTQRSALSEQEVLTAQVSRRSGQTPYAATGPWPALGLAAAITGLCGIGARKPRAGRSAGKPAGKT